MAQADNYSKQTRSAHDSITAPKSDKLLFINKDANNLSRTAEEIYAIGSHVSKGSRKWKRTNASLELDPSTGRILSSVGVESKPRTPDSPGVPTEGIKALTLRWRLSDGKVTGAMTLSGDSERGKQKGRKKIYQSATASPDASSPYSDTDTNVQHYQQSNLPMAGTTSPGASSPSRSVKEHIQFYLETIRPFALTLSNAWLWVNDAELIASSPTLTRAICAFTSAFRNSVKNGLHSLVLPPEPAEGRDPLWPVPEYFVLRAQTISLLHQHLATNQSSAAARPFRKAELHAMMFVMRLEILLGNQEAAILHLNAIKSATQDAAILPDLHIDIAMWKINLAAAYKYRSALERRQYTRATNPAEQQPFVEINELQVPERERRRLKAYFNNRRAIWNGVNAAPGAIVEDWLIIDPAIREIPAPIQLNVVKSLILSRYLLANLHYLNADTTNDGIRIHVDKLKSVFSAIVGSNADNFIQIWRRIPRIMFFVTFAGAYASRGNNANRQWFIKLLNGGISASGGDPSEEDLMRILDMFFDPRTVFGGLLREVWDKIEF